MKMLLGLALQPDGLGSNPSSPSINYVTLSNFLGLSVPPFHNL